MGSNQDGCAAGAILAHIRTRQLGEGAGEEADSLYQAVLLELAPVLIRDPQHTAGVQDEAFLCEEVADWLLFHHGTC